MKNKLLTFILVLSVTLLCSCNESSEVETDVNGTYIRTIGNHQYLIFCYNYGGGICHYEDCDYCKNNDL